MTHEPGREPEIDAPPGRRRLRCLRCNEVFPEELLGAHRRRHHDLGPYATDWTSEVRDPDEVAPLDPGADLGASDP